MKILKPLKNTRLNLALLMALTMVPLSACSEASEAEEPIFIEDIAPLKVLLFPYIPYCPGEDSFERMDTRLEAEFEEATSQEIDITIGDPDWILYSPEALAERLDEGEFDLVQIDTVILGELAESGAIRPWESPPNDIDWDPVALESSTYNDELWGLPHTMCGYFVFSFEEQIAGIDSLETFVDVLGDLSENRPGIAGKGLGSWTLSTLYLQSWLSNHPDQSLEVAITSEVEHDSKFDLHQFLDLCTEADTNACMSDTSKFNVGEDNSPDSLAKVLSAALVDEEVTSVWGYSELLHYIQRHSPEKSIQVIAAPLGDSTRPISFTNSMVLRTGCVDGCERVAGKFIEYFSEMDTMEWYLMGDECEGSPAPRYVIPALPGVYALDRFKNDPYYATFGDAMSASSPVPNAGLYTERSRIVEELLAE